MALGGIGAQIYHFDGSSYSRRSITTRRLCGKTVRETFVLIRLLNDAAFAIGIYNNNRLMSYSFAPSHYWLSIPN